MTFISALSASAEHAEEHAEGISLWEDYLGVAFDPAHILAELTFTVFIDFVLLFLVWGLFFKKVLLPRIRNDIRKDVHREIDAEHGVVHVDNDLDKPVATPRPDHLSPIPDGVEVLNRNGFPVSKDDLGVRLAEVEGDDITRSDG